ncbi:hypothetical protein DOT_6102 [Desulfosporosinus sp. OT]|nr:hypothetical protein DOT_6102 [Desulfosporosinus sp. OT]
MCLKIFKVALKVKKQNVLSVSSLCPQGFHNFNFDPPNNLVHGRINVLRKIDQKMMKR